MDQPLLTVMRPQNSVGTPVDPVPFIVVAGFGFLFCFGYGPFYLMELGAELEGALGWSAMLFYVTTGLAYYRFVWTARPARRSEVPAHLRLRRLVLGGVAAVGVLALLTLPLVALHLRA